MLSAFYICCIYSSALQTSFFMEANTKNPDQTAPLGPYCLQYSLPKNIKQMREQMTKVVTGGKRVNRYQVYIQNSKTCIKRPLKKRQRS